MQSWSALRELLFAALLALAILFVIVAALLAWLRRFLRRSRATPCAEVPEAVDRRPDPCLYSQAFLLQFFPGQPVTWDNPDITLTELDGTPVDSGSLQPAHDYVVHARIWDASFSPALGTLVRCSFHGFGFGALPNQPVETNPDGTPRVVVLHIPPWQNATADFRWRTPDAAGHFCLLVECSHPADANGWNNLGQENTVIRRGRAGGTVVVDALIANAARDGAQRVRFATDTYEVPRSEVELRLVRGAAAAGRDAAGELRFAGRPGRPVRYAYEGRDALMATNASASRPVPDGWRVGLAGETIELAPGETRTIPVTIEIPADAAPGPIAFNITSVPDRGAPGGITIRIHVEG